MVVSELIRTARERAGLSQRALAERSGTSAAAICLYERGGRAPRVDTLERILRAVDEKLILRTCPVAEIDEERNGRDLWEVLALADHLPQRHDDRLGAPQFAALAEDVLR